MFKNNTPTILSSVVTYNVINSRKLTILFETLFLVVGTVVGIVVFLDDLLTAILYFAIVALVIIIYPFFNKRLLKKAIVKSMQKSPTQDESTRTEFTFNEDNINFVSTRLDIEISNSTLTYGQLVEIIEYKSNLFIYIGINMAHILDKNHMLEGEYTQLTVFLKEKLGKKYKKFITPFF